MNIRHLACVAVGLLCYACGAVETGVGGSGGDSTQSSGGYTTSDDTRHWINIDIDAVVACEEEPAFDGSQECLVPHAGCCEFDGSNPADICHSVFEGELPEPVVCPASAGPWEGAATDYRVCMAAGPVYTCEQGPRWLQCCEAALEP